jgi:TonB family protein
MTTFQSWVLSYLLNSLWQIPLLCAAGWIAARTLRRVGVAAEHGVWVTVLLLQVLLPACSLFPWDWSKILFDWSGSAQRSPAGEVSVVIGMGTGAGALQLSPAILAAIAFTYCALTVFFTVRFLLRCRSLSRIRREATTLVLDGEAALEWTRCAGRYRMNGVSIGLSSHIFGPVTLGFTNKLVLLPAEVFAHLALSDFRTAIAHEFAHLKRNDFVKNLAYEILSLPVSYHPLFRFTRERIMESREMICDRIAAQTAGRKEYARSLLRLASLLAKGMPMRTPHAIGIFDANTFERRLMELTGNQQKLIGARRLALVVVCGAFGLATCGSVLAFSMHIDPSTGISDSAAPKTPGQVNVSPKVMEAQVLQKVPPVYPVEAKKARIQGKVVLAAIIGKDGSVENLKVISGPKELQKSSLDAVQRWVYKPFLLNGAPVDVKTTITVNYTLQR